MYIYIFTSLCIWYTYVLYYHYIYIYIPTYLYIYICTYLAYFHVLNTVRYKKTHASSTLKNICKKSTFFKTFHWGDPCCQAGDWSYSWYRCVVLYVSNICHIIYIYLRMNFRIFLELVEFGFALSLFYFFKCVFTSLRWLAALVVDLCFTRNLVVLPCLSLQMTTSGNTNTGNRNKMPPWIIHNTLHNLQSLFCACCTD